MDIIAVESIAKTSLLFDLYGGLLTEKQRQVMEFYHEENLSLAEIADEYGISRQAVHDALKKAEHALSEYEEKLGLFRKFMETRKAISDIDSKIDRLTDYLSADGDNPVSRETVARLEEIKNIINRLEE